MEEMVDVVDENDKVLYSTTKQKTHKEGLLHRTVIGQLINSKGKWILVKQSKNRQDPGKYACPVGGHIGKGESEVEALKREALEEIGLKKFTYKFIGKAIFKRHVLGRIENHYFILYEIFSDEKPKLNHESESYEMLTRRELKKKLKTNPNEFGQGFHFVSKTFYPDLLSWDSKSIIIGATT